MGDSWAVERAASVACSKTRPGPAAAACRGPAGPAALSDSADQGVGAAAPLR